MATREPATRVRAPSGRPGVDAAWETGGRLAVNVGVNIDHLIACRASGASVASRAIPSFVVAGGIRVNGTSLAIHAADPSAADRISSVTERLQRGKSQVAIGPIRMFVSRYLIDI